MTTHPCIQSGRRSVSFSIGRISFVRISMQITLLKYKLLPVDKMSDTKNLKKDQWHIYYKKSLRQVKPEQFSIRPLLKTQGYFCETGSCNNYLSVTESQKNFPNFPILQVTKIILSVYIYILVENMKMEDRVFYSIE